MPATSPVWFITAASSGFGHEIALTALQRGHTVIATARTPSRIQDLADAGAHVVAFDVTSPLNVLESTAKDIFSKFGRVDYLVNAAGYVLEGAVEEVTAQEVYDQFNTNVFGVINILQAFLPHMRSQDLGSNGVRGTVVAFGSLACWEVGPSYSIYSMTKACASSLAETLALELQPFKIRSVALEPGYFRTGLLNHGAKISAKHRIDAYDDENTPTGAARKGLDAASGSQPGDVKKGASFVLDCLTQTGAWSGSELPVRIPLGTDCDEAIRRKCAQSIATLDQWKDEIHSTDY